MNRQTSNADASSRAVNGLLHESSPIARLIRGITRSDVGFLRNYEHLRQL
jgi:hypothetical protein